jgi:hypothetical protein
MTVAEKYNNILTNLANTVEPPSTGINFKKASSNDIARFIYNEVNNNIQEAKKAGRIAANEDLNALGITAQILFETGYGRSELSSKYNNFGGHKAGENWKGQKVDMLNKQTKKTYSWRAYPTVKEGLKAQTDFLIDNQRYRKNGVFNAKTPQDYLAAVAKAGYAGGESDYVKKVSQVLEGLPKKLSNYDPNILKQWEEYKSQAATNPPVEYTPQNSKYAVQAPSLPAVRPYFDKGLGLTTEIDKTHEITQAMENAGTSQYLQKQVDAMEKPLFESLLKPVKFATGGVMQDPPRWLKWANPKLQLMPYYSSATTGILAPSAEIGIYGTKSQPSLGMDYAIKPHLGVAYNSNSRVPISGGIDFSAMGLKSPNDKGRANVDVEIGYNPAQGIGAGFAAGYKYRLGQSNSRGDELRVKKAALDFMPYAGWQVGARPASSQNLQIQGEGVENMTVGTSKGQSAPTYGIKGEAKWRPKLGMYSPLTFFASGNLNFNPVRGQTEQVVDYGGTTEGITGNDGNGYEYGEIPVLDQDSGLKLKPQFSGNIGAQISFKNIKNLTSKNYDSADDVEPYINPAGNFTFEQIYDEEGNRMPSTWNTGISPNFNRMSLEAETPEQQLNWINNNIEQLQTYPTEQTNNNYPYRYGGNFKNIFRDYRKK